MPLLFCPHCGWKHTYSGVKPKACASCDASLTPKPLPKPRQPARAHEDPEYEAEAPLEGINTEAVRQSIQLESDGNEGGFMTVESLRKSSGSFARGTVDRELQAKKDEVLKGLLGGAPATPTFTPPPESKPRSGARKAGRLTR